MNTLKVPKALFALVLLPFVAVAPALAQSYFQPDPVEVAGFGRSVAVSGDRILVGEPSGFKDPGTVHVYARGTDGAWMPTHHIQASDSHVGDGFGQTLAFDGRTLAIGSNYQVTTYVWHEGDASFNVIGSLDVQATDLAIDGQFLAVGAGQAGRGAGAVHVYRLSDEDAAWVESASFAGTDRGQMFGSAVDLDAGTLVVGTARGNQVTVYKHVEGRWVLNTGLNGADYEIEASFGSAIDMRGNRLLIGAPGTSQSSAGSAVIFEQDAEGSWVPVTTLTYPGTLEPAAGRRNFVGFGMGVKLVDDGAWIGAPGENGGRGQIYTTSDAGQELVQLLDSPPTRAGIGTTFDVEGSLAVAGLPGSAYGEGNVLVLEHQESWVIAGDLFNEGEPMTAIMDELTECTEGQALDYDCAQVDLVSFLPLKDMEAGRGVRLSDVWGWTDPATGSEYALVGHLEGTVFVNVSDPSNPVYLGTLPRTEGSPGSTWRDIKVYQNHAYIVADGAGAHGMQVFDLTQLRDIESVPVEFGATAHYDRIHSSHNVVINEDTGFAYAVGVSGGGETCGGGLHMIDIRQPQQPVFAGCFADETTGRRNTGYSHDAQCVIYHGPDADYQGQEICIGANETAISISDVTDKSNPQAVGTGTYPDASYVHQGWLSEDHGWFYQNDELDEISGRAERTRTLVWDVRDLEDPQLVKEYFGPTSATDHNLYVHGNVMYQTNNASGLRLIDISAPDNPVEVGFFDTTPYGTDDSGFNGTWSSYPYFESGIIVVTSRREGLFILRRQTIDT